MSVHAVILSVDDDTVTLGNQNGTALSVPRSSLRFFPRVGDHVNVYREAEKVYVTRPVDTADDGRVVTNPTSQATHTPSGSIQPRDRHSVRKGPYVFLALFLGGLGAHKFYANRIGAGLLYLIFSWTFVPMIIAALEALVAAVTAPDAAGEIRA